MSFTPSHRFLPPSSFHKQQRYDREDWVEYEPPREPSQSTSFMGMLAAFGIAALSLWTGRQQSSIKEFIQDVRQLPQMMKHATQSSAVSSSSPVSLASSGEYKQASGGGGGDDVPREVPRTEEPHEMDGGQQAMPNPISVAHRQQWKCAYCFEALDKDYQVMDVQGWCAICSVCIAKAKENDAS